jgi:hypothetical protein
MSDLSFVEKAQLEKLLGMAGGYILNFTNRTFGEFVTDSVRRDIYSGRYDYASCSKANLLRRFWEIEPNHVVGKLVSDLIELAEGEDRSADNPTLLDQCRRIAVRLRQGAPVEELDAIGEDLTERDNELLFKSIRDSIDSNEPEAGLDRLHTFATRFLRRLCKAKGIDVARGRPLHSLLGGYIKRMKAEGAIESHMTERILKSSIANLEAFNFVRNERSFAHDNPLLNYEESLLIFSSVVSGIRFLQALERNQADGTEGGNDADFDEVPF